MGRGVGPQLGGAQGGAVVLEQADARQERRSRAPAVAVGQPQEGQGVPGSHPQLHRAVVAGLAGEGELVAGNLPPAEFERHRRGEDPGVLGRAREPGRGQMAGGAAGAGEQGGGALAGQPRGPHRNVAGEGGPRRSPLDGERGPGPVGHRPRRRRVVVDERDLGQSQLGDGDVPLLALAGERVHRRLGAASRLGDQAGGELHLAAVDQAQPVGHLEGGQVVVGLVEAPKGPGDIAPQGDGQGHVLQRAGRQPGGADVGVQALGPAHVGLGRSHRPPDVVGHPPSGEGVRLAQAIAAPAEGGKGPPVAVERLVDLSEVQVETGPLRLQPGAHHAPQHGAGQIGLPQGTTRVTQQGQGADEAHAALGGDRGQAGPLGDGDRSAEMGRRVLQGVALPRRQAEGSLGQRRRLPVAGGVGPVEHLPGEARRPCVIAADQVERLRGHGDDLVVRIPLIGPPLSGVGTAAARASGDPIRGHLRILFERDVSTAVCPAHRSEELTYGGNSR